MAEKQPASNVTNDDRLWAALAYVFTPLSPIIILLMQDKKDRPFIKAHNMQALVYGLVLTILWIIAGFLTIALIGLCLYPFLLLAWLVALYWAYQAFTGEMVNIPVITDFVKNQGWA
jgi:uncharacterized membrane protein